MTNKIKGKILIVEDEAIVAEDMKMALEKEGYLVVDILSGEEGVEMVIRNEHPDLILMDIKLDGDADGIDIASRIRRYDVPVVFVTAYGNKQIIDRAKKASSYGFLNKPFDTKDLLTMVEFAVYKSKAEKSTRKRQGEYEYLLNSIEELVLIISKFGKILFCNKRTVEVTGYAEDELVGSFITRFLTKESAKRSIAALAREFAGHPEPMFDVEIKNKAGQSVILEIAEGSNPVMRDGKLIGTMVSARDVTRERRTNKLIKVQHDLSVELGSLTDLERAASLIVDLLVNIDGVDGAGLYLVEADGGIRLKAHKGLEKDFVEKVSYYPKDSEKAAFLRRGRAYVGKYSDFPGKNIENKARAVAVFPIRYKDELMASLNLAGFSADEFDSDTITILESISTQIGSVMHRIKTEETLKRSEENYKTVFESAAEALFLYKPGSGRIYDVNRTACHMFGYPKEEMRKKSLEDISDSRSGFTQARALEKIREADKGEIPVFEWRTKRKSGRIFWSNITLKKISINSQNLIMASVRDVSTTKMAEESVRRSEAKFRQLFDFVPDAIYLTDAEGNFADCNKAAEDLLGYGREELRGKNLFKIDIISKEDEDEALDVYQESIEGGEKNTRIFSIRKKGGDRIKVEITGQPFRQGDKVQFLSVARDITARLNFEKEIKKRNEDLQRSNKLMVGRELKMIELKRKVKELEERLEKGR